jgi:LAO/AO transport system kinase
MLELRRAVSGRPADHDPHHRPVGHGTETPARGSPVDWEPPIVRTVAVRDEGVGDLLDAIDRHRAHLEATGERRARETARARAAFVTVLRERLLAGALDRLEAEMGRLDAVAARIAAREADPYALAEELAARLRA